MHGVLEPDVVSDSDTVRRHRIELGFIGEAVMDDATVEDARTAAVRWRNEGMLVLPSTLPPMDPSPPRAPRQVATAHPHIVPHGFAVPPPPAPTPPPLSSVSPRMATSRPPVRASSAPALPQQSPALPPRLTAVRTALPQEPMGLEPPSESTVDPPRMLSPLQTPVQYLSPIVGGLMFAGMTCLFVLTGLALLLL